MGQKQKPLLPHEKIKLMEEMGSMQDNFPGAKQVITDAFIPDLKKMEKDPDPSVKSHAKRIRESLEKRAKDLK